MDREALDRVMSAMTGAQLQLLIMLLTRVEPLQIPLPILRQQMQARFDAQLLALNRENRARKTKRQAAAGQSMICPCGKTMRLTTRTDSQGDGALVAIWFCSCGYSTLAGDLW